MKNYFYAFLSKELAEEILEMSFTAQSWHDFSEWLRTQVEWNTQNEIPNVISATLEFLEASNGDEVSSSSDEFWSNVPELENTPWFRVAEKEIRVLHTRDEIESIAGQELNDAQWDEIVSRILGMYEDYTFGEDLQQFKDS